MKTITIEVPDDLGAAVGKSDADLPRALRLAAAIQWYCEGLLSNIKGAELAGVTRVEFINALERANVSSFPTNDRELKDELKRRIAANRLAAASG